MSNTQPERLHQVDRVAAFDEVVRERQSIRAFLPRPLLTDVLHAVLDQAQQAPSNCNTQPWHTHVVSGATLTRMSEALIAADDSGSTSMDFSFDTADFTGRMRERQQDQGRFYYTSLGIERSDSEGRRKASLRNYSFFGAPHAAFLFMPAVGDSVRVASDVGMYAQTLLLALTARGLGGIPQTILGYQADTVRQVLGLPDDLKLLFGISFGHPDRSALANQNHLGRDPICRSVTFHD